MIPLPKNIFSEGDVYTCTWSTKTTQTSDKSVVMKLGSVRYLEITTNHDVQSPFLHSWECELGMGAAAHCCSNLEIRAGEDWHFLLCYVSSHVFSSNQKQNRVISLIFAQKSRRWFHWLHQLQNSSLCLDWSDSSSCRRVCDSAARCRENQHDTMQQINNGWDIFTFYCCCHCQINTLGDLTSKL